jgi:hypothetical protein
MLKCICPTMKNPRIPKASTSGSHPTVTRYTFIAGGNRFFMAKTARIKPNSAPSSAPPPTSNKGKSVSAWFHKITAPKNAPACKPTTGRTIPANFDPDFCGFTAEPGAQSGTPRTPSGAMKRQPGCSPTGHRGTHPKLVPRSAGRGPPADKTDPLRPPVCRSGS